MRQWHVNPEILCNKHLLGEHVEHHMFVGTLKKKKKVDGFFKSNCLEPLSLQRRHRALVDEMSKRGMIHKSELDECDLSYLGDNAFIKVDSEKSLKMLIDKCPKCSERLEKICHLH